MHGRLVESPDWPQACRHTLGVNLTPFSARLIEQRSQLDPARTGGRKARRIKVHVHAENLLPARVLTRQSVERLNPKLLSRDADG